MWPDAAGHADGAGNADRATFSLFLSHQQPPDRDPQAALAEQLEMVAHVRDRGWDGVFTGHHYLLEGVRKLQPAPFLARLSAETGDLCVGTAVLLLALENPVEVAETVASLDVLTGGRFIFGAALGYREAEYDAFGIPPGERAWRFEANLDLVRRLLEGEEVTADLPWCRLDRARLANRPVQRPRPPIWLGANADRAVARAGRAADAWIVNPHARRDTVAGQVQVFRSARAEAGKPDEPLRLPALKEVYCAETREEAWRACAPYLGQKYRAYLSWGQDRAMPDGDTLDLPVEELVDQRFVVGSPEDCRAELRRWRDEAGVAAFVLRTEWSGMPAELAQRSLALLSEEVLPPLRAESLPGARQ
ncbi:LLM class flavin-dependent oxidoreductase [Egibacter rhizosphaerae]|uniref:LLM class flavin-dependent oxidoreductase n=1 Tax=Egibacter rhizosphaerae TaxID=1670831 RepID=A0A411YHD0_9ACTN|nr:LLM class flavin-dependent oxidoreductase [Egibacter rhizosphaerae]QBI20519.1 LLM class flavin-dependent oxidoreductase [Egibacter rhizosphaerae]